VVVRWLGFPHISGLAGTPAKLLLPLIPRLPSSPCCQSQSAKWTATCICNEIM